MRTLMIPGARKSRRVHDDMRTATTADAEALDELRGRIEILIDEIDIGLGIKPAPIPGLADLEAEPPD